MHERLAPMIEKRLSLGTTEADCWPLRASTVVRSGGSRRRADVMYALFKIPSPDREAYEGRRYVNAYRTLYEWYFDVEVPDDVMICRCPLSVTCGNPTHYATGPYPNGTGYRQRSLRLRNEDLDPPRTGRRRWHPDHCPNGHRYVPGSYLVRPDGGRRCRYCRRLNNMRTIRRRAGLPPLTPEEERRVNSAPLDVSWETAITGVPRTSRGRSRKVKAKDTDWRTAPMQVRLM